MKNFHIRKKKEKEEEEKKTESDEVAEILMQNKNEMKTGVIKPMRFNVGDIWFYEWIKWNFSPSSHFTYGHAAWLLNKRS